MHTIRMNHQLFRVCKPHKTSSHPALVTEISGIGDDEENSQTISDPEDMSLCYRPLRLITGKRSAQAEGSAVKERSSRTRIHILAL